MNALYFGDNKEASAAGFYTNPYTEQFLLTIADLLAGRKPSYRDFTLGSGSFKKACAERKIGEQPSLFGE